jgi:putative transposase
VVKEAGLDPGPDRGPTQWDDFMKRHASTLWAADFLSVKAWTKRGRKDHFILAFIHVGSRQVWLSPCTMHPTRAWVAQQARNFLMHCQFNGLEIGYLLRDRDGKYGETYDAIFDSIDIDVKPLPARSPNLNAFIERFIQTLKHECLEHFVILGAKHLDYLASQFVDYYHTRRPHQSMGNKPLLKLTDAEPVEEGEVVCEERLGGLLKHYYRKAA